MAFSASAVCLIDASKAASPAYFRTSRTASVICEEINENNY